MLDAADALADEKLADRAVNLARQVPTSWENPDIAHGLAGAGLTSLHFWRRTGDDGFADRVRACADELAHRVTYDDGGPRWSIPATFDSRLAGVTHLGFAHGSAGIAYFLLVAGRYAGRSDWTELAVRTGRHLLTRRVSENGAALWPSTVDDPIDPMEHWCSGGSGIGTLLVRLWQATGERSFLDVALDAATAVYRRRWHPAPVQCHGLAGNGEFLLDLADATGNPSLRRWAEELAWIGYLRGASINGRLVLPDETMTGFGCEYGTGMSGFLGFLLRLRYRSSRQWMVDDPGPTDAMRHAA